MSEADYMDDSQHVDRWDDENAGGYTHEVVDPQNRQIWSGSKRSCWAFKRRHGGYVREVRDDQA